MIDGVSNTLELFILAATALALAVGWVKKVRPWMAGVRRDFTAGRDALVGREEVVDSITGKQLSPPLPGIGQRMAHQETQMDRITEAVAQLASTHTRIENHEGRIQKLEEASVERVVAKAESAAAWRAMEATALATPDETHDA